MKLIHVLSLLIYISFQSVHLLYSDLQEFSMIIIGCFYFSLCIHLVHSTIFLCCTLWTIIDHLFIGYLISLYKRFAHCYFFEIMNHLTLCSSSNHLLYPCFLYCKVHVSFITFILEDEHELSLGMLMHLKCIHELCTIKVIFQSYLHHIKRILLLFNDFQ